MPTHAIVGCGRVAPNHVDGFAQLDDYPVVWACDRQAGRAREFAGLHSIPRVASDLAEVLADPGLTSVSVAVDHAQHADLAERALLAGKHVLVEKPLALSVVDAERLVKLASDRGLVLAVVAQHRYDPVVLAVRDWIAEGLLGRVLYVQASLEAYREPGYYADSYWRGSWDGEGGSALMNQGYHCLDVTGLLCGELTVRAAVASRRVLGRVIETEDSLSALLIAGDVPVTLHVTVGSTTVWRTRIELVGDGGTVSFDIDHPGRVHRASGSPELERRAAELGRLVVDEPPPGISYYGISHRRLIADFATAVTDRGPMAYPAQTGVDMVRLLADLYGATRMQVGPA